ncbi:hypothetical protein AV530_005092 [Patagioenas fasciata monilis]|uniref:Uncharacterized protein n=1 Tax=Patagioenas fasciata monilis TaxID=372326 RepID=A0A1V4K426_PATFA|nr:hypothetical protein AV530_005092 [Patagioenas fasciata monilis]
MEILFIHSRPREENVPYEVQTSDNQWRKQMGNELNEHPFQRTSRGAAFLGRTVRPCCPSDFPVHQNSLSLMKKKDPTSV